MEKKRRKTAYFILVLLILLVVAIIGGLAMVLFNMTFSVPKNIPPAPPVLHTNIVERVTPVSEKFIEVHAKEIPPPPQERPVHAATVVPAICDGYGPQIQSRDAYKDPVTYSASIQPNHVKFTIYANRKINSK